MAEERGAFNLTTVISKIHNKMVNRHPHVFGEVEVKDENDVMQNWEQLKKKEGKKSALEGVPNNLPALLRAERIQFKASRVGFDWDKKEDVWAKVEEEMKELKAKIKESAKQNRHSMNAEIVGRLEASYEVGNGFEGLNPEQAQAVKLIISQFKQTNPVKAENKSLTYPLDI